MNMVVILPNRPIFHIFAKNSYEKCYYIIPEGTKLSSNMIIQRDLALYESDNQQSYS